MGELRNTVNKLIAKGFNTSANEYSSKLRRYAIYCGWPTNVAGMLSIVVDGDKFNISYPKDIEDEVFTLEFGTEITPPNPVIRTFMLDMDGGRI